MPLINEPQQEERLVSGAAGSDETTAQTQVLGQVAQTLTSLAAKLSAVTNGESGHVCGQGQGNDHCRVQGQGQHVSSAGGHPLGNGRSSGMVGRGGGNGAGYGGHGIPNMAPFHLPQDMMWYPGMTENVRSVELPQLPGIRGGELGRTCR